MHQIWSCLFMHAILNTPCYGLEQVQNNVFFFDSLSKQEQQLKNKTTNKAMGITRYSFADLLCTLFNFGLCWGFCICYPGSVCILCHLPASWWPYQNIKLFHTSSELPSSFHLQQNDQIDNSSAPHSATANYCKTWLLKGGYCNKVSTLL